MCIPLTGCLRILDEFAQTYSSLHPDMHNGLSCKEPTEGTLNITINREYGET